LAAAVALEPASAADIQGTIIIKRKLTRRKVTASQPAYQRGPAVDLAADPDEDPLAFERSRVVVYLDGPRPSPPATFTMEQKGRRFIPDTLVVPAGSTVSFPNLDPIFHNVFSLSKPKSFDLGNYPRGQTRTVMLPKPGVVFVHCHLHPNMAAAIIVTPNQWNTKSDGAGRFALSAVPPGNYTVVAWHKAAGFFRQEVQVTAAGSAPVQFVIPLDENGVPSAVAHR
jgi:plastocyanin